MYLSSTRGKREGAPTEARKKSVRAYLLDLAKVHPMYREGSAVLIVMNQSCRHVGYDRTASWPSENQTTSNTKRNGGRAITMHAIARDGPLVGGSFVDEQIFSRHEGWFMKGGRRPSFKG